MGNGLDAPEGPPVPRAHDPAAFPRQLAKSLPAETKGHDPVQPPSRPGRSTTVPSITCHVVGVSVFSRLPLCG